MRALSFKQTNILNGLIKSCNQIDGLLFGLLIGLLLMLSTTPSWAEENTQDSLTLSGKATYRWFGIKIYDIALYLYQEKNVDQEKNENQEKKPFDLRTTRPLSLKITYDMDIEAVDLIENTAEQWQKIALGKSETCTNQTHWLQQLKSIWPNINSGDSLTLTIDGHQASTFYHNDIEKGRIDDVNFGHCFSAIWLANDTSEPKIRRKLLKNAG
jgi:hypothetical protein